jgi:hypothetical protein
MKKHFVIASVFALLGVGVAVWEINSDTKSPIDQEFVLKPSTAGMTCAKNPPLTACDTKDGGVVDGVDYELLVFVTGADERAAYFLGRFKKDQFGSAYADLVSKYGEPDDKLGEAGDRRGIWFFKNGVAVMRERATKVGLGSSAFSLFCFQGQNEEVNAEMGEGCQKMFAVPAS